MPTTLIPGDIAILGFNADNPDAFSFVTLVDLEAGTEISFTDSGVQGDGSFRGNEGAVRYTAPVAVPAGTVIAFDGIGGAFSNADDAAVGNNGFALSASGDQVIAFQGTSAAPTFLFAVQSNSTGFQAEATSSNTSSLPTGLIVGQTAVAAGAGAGGGDEFDNIAYNGSVMSGDRETLLAAIADPGNWTGDNARVAALPSGPFTVTGVGAAAPVINEFQPNPEGADPATQLVELKGAPGASFEGFLFSIESDAGTSANTVDRKSAISGTFDEGGLLTVTIPDLENPSFTLVLTDATATAGLGDVIDPASPMGLGGILDAVGVADAASDPVIGAALGGTDIAFTGTEPKLVFRDGATGELFAVNDPDGGAIFDEGGTSFAPGDFDIDPLAGDTFGAANPSRVGEEGDDDGVVVPPAITRIHTVQGSGTASPLTGSIVTVQGIVTASFIDGLGGFYMQEEDADADGDPATSEGIFVFAPGLTEVLEEGYTVTVTGTVGEGFGQTQLADVEVSIDSTDLTAVTAAAIGLPVPDGMPLEEFYEPFEGMLVQFQTTLTITQLFNYERFGELQLSEGGRVFQYTQTDAPVVAGNAAFQDEQSARRIVLDDGNSGQNPASLPFLDVPEFSAGDTVENLTGVLSFGFGRYALQPTETAPIEFVNTNPRQPVPDDVGGSLKVASFNVLNYFTTLNVPANAGSVNGLDPRGANSEAELDRQASKIVAALAAMDADVVGLIEIENDDDTAMLNLVARLNAAQGSRVYDVVPTGVIGTDAIKVGFIYDTATVRIAEGTTVAVLDDDAFVAPVSTLLDPGDLLPTAPANRPAVAVTFEEIATGERFTAVNNHLKSKGSGVAGEDFDLLTGASLGTIDGEQPVIGVEDGQGSGSATREAAADQLVKWLATNPTGSSDADQLILGDLNAYAQETAIAQIVAGADGVLGTGDDFTDLAQAFVGEGAYSFRFSGQWGTLDYALANQALLSQVTGVTIWNVNSDEPALLDYNDDVRDPGEASFNVKPAALEALFDPNSPFQSSDHDPVVVGLDLSSDPIMEPQLFSLEILHLTDQELSSADLADIPRASAILNLLDAQDLGGDGIADNTIRLSSGDLSIPGAFFSASEAVFGSRGIADIQIANEMGFAAVALGNHEFDGGTAELAALIDGSATGDFSVLSGTALDGQDFAGTAFPFLAANLDFSTDANLAPLAVEGGLAPQGGVVTSSVVAQVNGAPIGIVGAITPTLGSISSPGGAGIFPSPFGSPPTAAQLDALAAEIQAEVDAVLSENPGLNKVVLLAHMQQIEVELGLASRLSGVDVILAGGSNTRLLDGDDRLRPGDTAQGAYPLEVTDSDGNTTLVVNTDGSAKYVGRLVIDFDADGNIVPGSYDPAVSGAFATDAQGLADAAALTGLDAAALVDPEVQAIVDAIGAQIIATEGNVFGVSEVFLNGNRSGGDTDGVRTQETNLGNLTADANLAAAKALDPAIVVSIKNGGGIRDSIGETVVPAGGSGAVRQANGALSDADGNVIKPAGGISQNDIGAALAFNNGLAALTLTASELAGLLEHGVSALPGVAGAFPQVGGIRFSFDESAPVGSRVQNAAILDADGNATIPLIADGVLVGSGETEYRVVTLGFLAEPRFDADGTFIGGGDGYPFPNLNTDPMLGEVGDPQVIARANLVDLTDPGVRTGGATFADNGTEQDALAEYLDSVHNPENGGAAFAAADTGRDLDTRIQNLQFRDDDVFDFDEMFVGNGDRLQRFTLTDGLDTLVLGADLSDGVRQRFLVNDFEAGDRVSFAADDILSAREAGPNLLVFIDNDERDSFTFFGVDSVETLFADTAFV